MVLREFGRLQKIIGRRDALKYGGLGLLSLAVTACGGQTDEEAASAAGDGPGRPTATGAAVAAFARGPWNLSFTPKGQANDEYARISITGRTWSLDDGDLTGSYELTDGRLVVTVNERDSENVWAGTGLPGTVGDSASLTLKWGEDAASGPVDEGSPVDTTAFPLPVTWDGRTLKITAQNGLFITAVRA